MLIFLKNSSQENFIYLIFLVKFKRLFEKYYIKPVISKNLTPLPPSLQGNGGFKASPLAGERFGEGSVYTFKT
ncbi:MAG: hypothetical protein AN482_16530, partial [Anabaena sp. LE011-02]